ncbi:SinI family restriction endonuclease [Clostridium polynesiense]|uniref:SinI family restriction endonuclease n=1 Tax=Clostridium polynesiense TaxID=1325933 RepID=UPI0006945B80|nr:SinI family restriction endonuclease [Clostridium polynesiense]
MTSYTIANINLTKEYLRECYSLAKSYNELVNWHDLDIIFEIALMNMDYFPGIKIQGQQNPQIYIDRWVKGYSYAVNNLPSKRTANPKGSCTDPAIKAIVQGTQGLSDEEAKLGETIHNLFMSAENIQGNLLEEYIATKVRPYGLIWCAGNVLRAIDFCNTEGTFLLQVKNKSNTENSSSSNIRVGTTIIKWYRLGTQTRKGLKYPAYKWDNLISLINQFKTEGQSLPQCIMSESDYQAFLKSKSTANRTLITSL